jgi:predicted SprT family Zn-dependent metalloprotease
MPFSVPTRRLSLRAMQTYALAYALLARYGLHDWSFALNRRKSQMGLCLFDEKAIALSVHFIELNDDDAIRDTLLHEIAHALTGPGHGHDTIWKRTCVEVGAKPERLCYDVNMPQGRWQATCGSCGMLHHRHRRPKHRIGWHCRHCGQERGKLIWQLALTS